MSIKQVVFGQNITNGNKRNHITKILKYINIERGFKMKNSTRRVVILKNVNSDLIEQAILVLKDSAADGDSKIIREAEKIVEKYMDRKSQKIQEEKKPKRLIFLSLGIAFISISALIFAFFV